MEDDEPVLPSALCEGYNIIIAGLRRKLVQQNQLLCLMVVVLLALTVSGILDLDPQNVWCICTGAVIGLVVCGQKCVRSTGGHHEGIFRSQRS